MQTDVYEMSVSVSYDARGTRRIRLLKLLRIAMIVCLFMAWSYAIAVAAAFVMEGNGAATLWMLQFVIYTIPATAVLICSWIALGKLNRAFDYCLAEDQLEIWASPNPNRRKLVSQINCFSIVSLRPAHLAAPHSGGQICACVSKANVWALDVRHRDDIVRVWLQPNETLTARLKKYIK